MSIEECELPKLSLRDRLNNWSKERSLLRLNQRQVRQRISTAIMTDTLNPVGSENVPEKLIKYRQHVYNAVEQTIINLSKIQPEGEIVAQSAPQVDQQTGIKFITQIRQESNAWISEEIDADSNPISQAKINDDGSHELILNFPNLDKDGANPGLMNESGFPTGTKVLFLNHAASLGVISWNGR